MAKKAIWLGSFGVGLWSLYLLVSYGIALNDKTIDYSIGAGRVFGSITFLMGAGFLALIAILGAASGSCLPTNPLIAATFQLFATLLLLLVDWVTISNAMTAERNPISFWSFLSALLSLWFLLTIIACCKEYRRQSKRS